MIEYKILDYRFESSRTLSLELLISNEIRKPMILLIEGETKEYNVWYMCNFNKKIMAEHLKEDNDLNIVDVILLNITIKIQILEWPNVMNVTDVTDNIKQKAVNNLAAWFDAHFGVYPKINIANFQFLWDYLRI